MLNHLLASNRKIGYIALTLLLSVVGIFLLGRYTASQNENLLFQDVLSRDRYLLPNEDEFWRGSSSAKIVIVEYTDFDCPFCLNVERDIHKLLSLNEGNKETVALVLRHYPLVYLHKNAYEKAVAFECLKKQHDPNLLVPLFFKLQQQSTDYIINSVIAGDKTKKDKMSACLGDGSGQAEVDEAMAKAAIAGVKSTPTFVVYMDGRQVASFSGSSVDRLTAIVQSILSSNRKQ